MLLYSSEDKLQRIKIIFKINKMLILQDKWILKTTIKLFTPSAVELAFQQLNFSVFKNLKPQKPNLDL